MQLLRKEPSDLSGQLPGMVICDDHLHNCNIFFPTALRGFFKGLNHLKSSSAARLDSLLFERFFPNPEQFGESST